MKIEDLMDMTLREVLDSYGAIYNPECGYYYGIASFEDIDELYYEYDIDEVYPEAFEVENLIRDEIIVAFDEELISFNRLEKIMKNLDIPKKDKE